MEMMMSKHQSMEGGAAPIQLMSRILLPFSVVSAILSYLVLAYGLQEQLFSFNIDKNYMFIVCNGLLAVIATSSGLIGTTTATSSVEKGCNDQKDDQQKKVDQSCDDQKKQGSAIAEAEVDQGSEEERKETVLVEEDEEEEGAGLMSKEELNKKCEEFIRKMREEIKFEAQGN